MTDLVRVVVRARPLLNREVRNKETTCTTFPESGVQISVGGKNKKKQYTFDHAFDTTVRQEVVFKSCVMNLLEGTLEGYNSTIFAYGQTGSGKTYTMGTNEFNPNLKEDKVGIIPRAAKYIFNGIMEAKKKDIKIDVSVQFLELYQDEFNDLFVEVNQAPKRKALKKQIKIMKNPKTGAVTLQGVKTEKVANAEQMMRLLAKGTKARKVAETALNKMSSRSHAIFVVILNRKLQGDKVIYTSKFNFVDLAGSEKIKDSKVTGTQQKEAISINVGLSALGRVITALDVQSRCKKKRFISYRESKLTMLLEDSLGGMSRTLMIACVSSSERDMYESMNTLNYANKARNIKNIGQILKENTAITIAELRSKILLLEVELGEFRQGRPGLQNAGKADALNAEIKRQSRQAEFLKFENSSMDEVILELRKNISGMEQQNDGAVLGLSQAQNTPGATALQDYEDRVTDLNVRLLEAEKMCAILKKHILSKPQFRTPEKPQAGDQGYDPLIALVRQNINKGKQEDVNRMDQDLASLQEDQKRVSKEINDGENLMNSLLIALKLVDTDTHSKYKIIRFEKYLDHRNRQRQEELTKNPVDETTMTYLDYEIKKIRLAIKNAQKKANENKHLGTKLKQQHLNTKMQVMEKTEDLKLIEKAIARKLQDKPANGEEVRLREKNDRRVATILFYKERIDADEAELVKKRELVEELRKGPAWKRKSDEMSTKWDAILEKVRHLSITYKAVEHLKNRMDFTLSDRAERIRTLSELTTRRDQETDATIKADLDTQIDNGQIIVSATNEIIDVVQEDIVVMDDVQHKINIQEVGDLVETQDEGRFLVENLFQLAVQQGVDEAWKDVRYKLMEFLMERKKEENALLSVMLKEFQIEARIPAVATLNALTGRRTVDNAQTREALLQGLVPLD